jgi:Flp pilus assembly protein TadG
MTTAFSGFAANHAAIRPECPMSAAAFMRRWRAFLANRRGNVAVIFALSLIPLVLAAGAGLDYARGVIVRNALSRALDSAALAVGATPGLSQTQIQTLAQQYFDANYRLNSSYGTPSTLSVAIAEQTITIAVNDLMPTTFLRMLGINNLPVEAASTVVWGQMKMWVALVLDNTGSMCASDSNPYASSPCPYPASNSKIASLKTATHSLLNMLQGAASKAGDVQVAIIPFVKDVNVGKGFVNASWLDWSDWNAANGSCNINGKNDQASCQVNGTWSGNKCNIPGYNSKNSCQKAVGSWTPDSHSTWNGCVMDRGNDSGPDTTYNYDVKNSAPVSSRASSKFATEQYSACPQSLMGLSYDWSSLNSKVDAMAANGSTNQTIGLVWGWHALSQGDPMNAPALPQDTARYIIILSDGLNTQNRWYGGGASQSPQVDARMALVCSNAKAAGIVVYAVYVDINGAQGNSGVLQSCASDPSKYFDLKSAGQISATFAAIGQEITNLRVSQ